MNQMTQNCMFYPISASKHTIFTHSSNRHPTVSYVSPYFSTKTYNFHTFKQQTPNNFVCFALFFHQNIQFSHIQATDTQQFRMFRPIFPPKHTIHTHSNNSPPQSSYVSHHFSTKTYNFHTFKQQTPNNLRMFRPIFPPKHTNSQIPAPPQNKKTHNPNALKNTAHQNHMSLTVSQRLPH